MIPKKSFLLSAALLCAACGSSGPAVLASNESAPVAVAADASAVYWLAGNEAAGASTLRKLLLTGGAKPTTLATGFDDPRALVLDSGFAYWASGDGAIRRIALDGATPAATLAQEPAGFQPFALAVRGGTVYWLATQIPDDKGAGNAVLASAPSAGGARTVVAPLPVYPQPNASLITADATTVYWAQADGDVRYLDPAGKQVPLSRRQGQLAGLAVVGGNAYWVANFSNTMGVVRKPLGSLGEPTLVVTVPITSAVVADERAIYIASPTSVAISRVSVADGSLSTLASDPSGANSAAVGPGGLYFTSSTAGGEGRVLKVDR